MGNARVNDHKSVARPFVSILASLTFLGMSATGGVAADCGDSAGPGGSRVACDCGDTLVTSAVLKKRDPVTRGQCPGNGLTIATHTQGITLDCRGRKITGSGAGVGIYIESASGATIRRCKIEGFKPAILGWNLYQLTLDRSVLQRNQGYALDCEECAEVRVSGSRIDHNGSGIIADQADNFEIERNTIARNEGDGVWLIEAWGNRIERNKITNNEGTGVLLMFDPGENVVARNVVDRNGGDGVMIEPLGTNNLVAGNKARRNKGVGICVPPENIDGGQNKASKNGETDISFTGCPG